MSEITSDARSAGSAAVPDHGLDLVDVAAIHEYFRAAGREPTEMEMRALTTAWGVMAPVRLLSAEIEYDGPLPGPDGDATAVRQVIDGLRLRDPRRAGIDPEDVLSGMGGEITPDGRYQITHDGQVVGDLPLSFLLDGWPRQTRQAKWRPPPVETTTDEPEATRSMGEHLLAMLAQRNTRDANPTQDSRPVDHTPSKLVTIKDTAPPYGALDPYRMGWAGVDKVMGALVCAGADPRTAVLAANFHVSQLEQPDSLGALVRALQGFDAAASAHECQTVQNGFTLPVDENEQAGVPPFHIWGSAELKQDSRQLKRGFRQAGNFIILVGRTRPELGGSLFSMTGGHVRPQHRHAPGPIEEPRARQQALHQAMRAGLVRAGCTCGEGGIALALAGLCVAGELGADIQMRAIPVDPYYAYAADEAILFSESLGRYLVEVRPEDAAAFSDMLDDVVHACIGVVGGSALRIHPRLPGTADPALSIGVDSLRRSLDGVHLDPGQPR